MSSYIEIFATYIATVAVLYMLYHCFWLVCNFVGTAITMQSKLVPKVSTVENASKISCYHRKLENCLILIMLHSMPYKLHLFTGYCNSENI